MKCARKGKAMKKGGKVSKYMGGGGVSSRSMKMKKKMK
jgi:hypothetical protein